MTFSNISTKRRSHSAAELNFLILSSSSFSPLAFVRDPELNFVLPVQGNLHSDVYQQSYNVTYRCMYFLQYFLLIILLYLDWKISSPRILFRGLENLWGQSGVFSVYHSAFFESITGQWSKKCYYSTHSGFNIITLFTITLIPTFNFKYLGKQQRWKLRTTPDRSWSLTFPLSNLSLQYLLFHVNTDCYHVHWTPACLLYTPCCYKQGNCSRFSTQPC